MKNRQKIFILIGTIIFSFIIYTIARQDHFIKTRTILHNAVTISDATTYKRSSKKSDKTGNIPKGTRLKVAPVANGFYRIVEKEGIKATEELYIPDSSIHKADTVLQY